MADSRTHIPTIPADVSDAVYRVVHDYGAQRLAALTGTPAGTILNKANPNDSSHHKPTLADGIIWSLLSQDYRIAHAFAQTLGGVFVPLHEQMQQSDAALLDLILERDEALGEYAKSMKESLADGTITRDEFDDLKRDMYMVVTACLTLLARLEGMARD